MGEPTHTQLHYSQIEKEMMVDRVVDQEVDLQMLAILEQVILLQLVLLKDKMAE